MKIVKLTLTFRVPDERVENLPKLDEQRLRYLLCDAFGKFKGHRWPPEKYIAERYPDGQYQWMNRAEKIKSTYERCEVAEFLRNGAAGMISIALTTEPETLDKEDE